MTTTTADVSAARLLGATIEPLAGQVHFSPECHATYETLGFGPSPGKVGLTAPAPLRRPAVAGGAARAARPAVVRGQHAAGVPRRRPHHRLDRSGVRRRRDRRAQGPVLGTAAAGAHGGRGWTETQLAAAEDRLHSRGLLDGDRLTQAGREAREAVEAHTGAQLAPALAVLGAELAAVIDHVTPWSAAVRDAGGYLSPAVRFTFWSPPAGAPQP